MIPIPSDGVCPVCGADVEIEQVDMGSGLHHAMAPGRWWCPNGCDPRAAAEATQ